MSPLQEERPSVGVSRLWLVFGVAYEIPEALPNIFVSGSCSLLQTKKIGCVIPAPSAEL